MAKSVPHDQRQMSMQSQTIGNHYRKAINATVIGNPNESKQIINEGEEVIREQYVKIFELQETVHKTEPNWWKTEFENAGKLLVDAFESKDKVQSMEKFNIAYNGKMYEFDNKRAITIGRYGGCDIQFPPREDGTSRLHALIFLFPENPKYVVADMGSMRGIITEKRSTDKSCTSSVPRNRNILIFDWTETAILILVDKKISINPKECVICLTEPRNCTFDCGHYLVCNNCKNKIHECPVCRTPINTMISGLRMETFFVKK